MAVGKRSHLQFSSIQNCYALKGKHFWRKKELNSNGIIVFYSCFIINWFYMNICSLCLYSKGCYTVLLNNYIAASFENFLKRSLDHINLTWILRRAHGRSLFSFISKNHVCAWICNVFFQCEIKI